MLSFLGRFHRAEGGAVTVDWVVLTAVMTGFGLAIALIVSNAATDPADGVGAVLTAQEVGI